MTAEQTEQQDGDDLLTVDELAAATGLTVRTTRYYAGLGLIPAPVRRGRMVYYDERHRARLDLVRALQDHGFTLAAIERYLSRLPDDATAEQLALQRVMLTSWKHTPPESLTRTQLEKRAGIALDEETVTLLEELGAVRREGSRFEVLTGFDTAVSMLGLDLSLESMVEANAAIKRHMDALADELTEVLRNRVLAPARAQLSTAEETARFETMMTRLRELTMQAVVNGYQRAADEVIRRSLTR